nr:unnamed protein product [Spirometra erinaceieuropaei]
MPDLQFTMEEEPEVATHAAQMGHIFNFDAVEIKVKKEWIQKPTSYGLCKAQETSGRRPKQDLECNHWVHRTARIHQETQ